MYLGNLEINESGIISNSIVGNFISEMEKNIIIVKGTSSIELISIEYINDSCIYKKLISLETFSQIRKIEKIHDSLTKKDNLVVLSDSGKVSIFEANINEKKFIRKNQETYGKSGCRRVTPGEYLSVDLKGRSIIIGAIEKEKYIYNFKNDEINKNNNLMMSPLEVFNPNYICYDLAFVDVGYNNPAFISIECKYISTNKDVECNDMNNFSPKKILIVNQVDIKNNYIVRLMQKSLDNSAYMIIPNYYSNLNNSMKSNSLQGSFLIICKNCFFYFKTKESKIIKEKKYDYPADKTKKLTEDIIMINNTSYFNTDKDIYYILTQSQSGMIYKYDFFWDNKTYDIENIIITIIIKINPSANLNILNNLLFCGRELNDSEIYLIKDVEKGISLKKVKNIDSLNGVRDFVYGNFDNSKMNKVYCVLGNNEGAYLSSIPLKTYYTIDYLNTEYLPAEPINMWKIKKKFKDEKESIIMFSFINKSLVFEYNEKSKSLSEMKNCCFETKTNTIHITILKDNSYLQVLTNGILHIRTEKKATFLKSSSSIKNANSATRQLAVGLENNELLYFEFDEELNKPEIKVIGEKISNIEFTPANPDTLLSKYLLFCKGESTINLLSVERDRLFYMASSIEIPDEVNNIKILENKNSNSMLDNFNAFVGLKNGVLVIINFSKTYKSEESNFQFQTQIQTKFISEEKLNLYNLNNSLILLTDNKYNYLCKPADGEYSNNIDYSIKKINIEEHINVALSINSKKDNQNVLLFTQRKKLFFGNLIFNDSLPKKVFKLKYNPKNMILTLDNNFILLENSNNNKSSCVQIVSPIDDYNLLYEFEYKEETIISYHLIKSYNGDESIQLLFIGTASNYIQYPIKKYKNAYIYLYKIYKDVKNSLKFSISLILKDEVEGIPNAICDYQNRVLCGINSELIMYEIGKEHFLKKSRSNIINDEIISISIFADRILVVSRRNSLILLKYNELSQLFYTLLADDFYTRYINKARFIDYDTIAGCDKFENFFIYKIPKKVEDENILYTTNNDSFLHSSKLKLELAYEIHLPEIITNFQLVTFSREVSEDTQKNENDQNEIDNEISEENVKTILYCTLGGAIGVITQFNKNEDALFFSQLELTLREYWDEPLGRSVLASKSQYIPVKNIIDINLINKFFTLTNDSQKKISEEVGNKTVNEIKNNIFDLLSYFK